ADARRRAGQGRDRLIRVSWSDVLQGIESSGGIATARSAGHFGAVHGGRPMLVLSRQRDETIMIGDEIEITVVDIRGDKVRLGITAPTKIAVHRKEVYDA